MSYCCLYYLLFKQGTSHIKGSTATDRTRGEGEGEVSLMDLEDGRDENFDPLTRTGSLGSKSYSNTSLSLGNQTVAPPPSGSNGVMTELSGLDLTLSSQTNTPFQNGTGAAILQAHQMDNSLFSSSSTASHAPQSGVVGGAYGPIPAPQLAVGGGYGGVQIPGRVGYVTAGPIPYGMQTGQTTVPQVSIPLCNGTCVVIVFIMSHVLSLNCRFRWVCQYILQLKEPLSCT